MLASVFAVGLILALWHVAFNVYPHSAIALARYNLFELRDDLFNLAAEGKLDFRSPGYRACRQMINGFIRYAHDMSLMQMVTTQLVAKVRGQKISTKEWDAAIERLDPEARKLVESVMRQAMVHMIRLLITKSVILSAIFAVVLFTEIACKTIARFAAATVTAFRRNPDQNVSLPPSDAVIREVMSNSGGRRLRILMKREAKRYTSPGYGMDFAAAA